VAFLRFLKIKLGISLISSDAKSLN